MTRYGLIVALTFAFTISASHPLASVNSLPSGTDFKGRATSIPADLVDFPPSFRRPAMAVGTGQYGGTAISVDAASHAHVSRYFYGTVTAGDPTAAMMRGTDAFAARSSDLLPWATLAGERGSAAQRVSALNNEEPHAYTSVIAVTNTNDDGPGSLRDAIYQVSFGASATPGPAEIDFAVAGTIHLKTTLETFSKQIFFNGASVSGYSGTPLVELDGTNAVNPGGSGMLFFDYGADGSHVRGLAFSGFSGGPGIMGEHANNVLVEECNFGTTPDGRAASGYGNTFGILPGPGWTIRNCVITGNSQGAIVIHNGMNGVHVLDSLIGEDRNNQAWGNGSFGISMANSAGVTISGCVISGNSGPGISVGPGSTNTLVTRNGIGLGTPVNNATSTNTGNGIEVGSASNVTIVGNTVCANGGNGIHIGPGANNVNIQGNYIVPEYVRIEDIILIPPFGDTISRYTVRNGANGISVDNASNVTIGGRNAGAGNIISGNVGSGITIQSTTGVIIQGNSIFSNGLDGINIGSSKNVIGIPSLFVVNPQTGATIGYNYGANVIGLNGRNGVTVTGFSNTGNSIQANSFYGNKGLGIDLNNDGVTANHSCNVVNGPNNFQNFPVVASANTVNGVTTIAGTLVSSPTNSQYAVNLFYSPDCNASGYGEGRYYIGSAAVTTDSACNSSFSLKVPSPFSGAAPSALPVGGFITATATDSSGNTSEFSQCRQITGDPGSADLSVTQSASPGRVTAGSNITYTVKVTNSGPDPAGSVTLSDTLPPGTSFVSCQATAGGACGGSGNDRSVTFNSLAAGGSGTVTIVATVNGAGAPGTQLNNQVMVTSSTPDPNPQNNSSLVMTTIAPSGPLPTVQFDSAYYIAGEGIGHADISVSRSGDTSGASTVDYNTSDGTATQRNKYTPAVGTLTFAPGETRKTFTVQITDEAYVEGKQTVNLTLSNPTDATLGSQSTATLTIVDNDTVTPTTNPIDDSLYFVRAHYSDFLNRVPDPGGFDYWSNQIDLCGADQSCVLGRRVGVSAAYFTSQEFQDTGYFVYRLYKAGLARQPNYAEFVPDRSRVVGGADLEPNKTAFANLFVTRGEFTAKYPNNLTAAQYVDALNANTGMSLTQAERDALVNGLTNQTETRASVLRKVADNQVFQQKEYNPAFVLMQYFGYLRRDPDAGGYQFWLSVMNGLDKSAFKGMTCSFITSFEYQDRFSPVRTHSNADCGNAH